MRQARCTRAEKNFLCGGWGLYIMRRGARQLFASWRAPVPFRGLHYVMSVCERALLIGRLKGGWGARTKQGLSMNIVSSLRGQGLQPVLIASIGSRPHEAEDIRAARYSSPFLQRTSRIFAVESKFFEPGCAASPLANTDWQEPDIFQVPVATPQDGGEAESTTMARGRRGAC